MQLNSGIEKHGDTFILTGDGIDTYRLLWMWNGLLLEIRTGMKMSRYVTAHQAIKAHFGWKGNRKTCAKKFAKFLVEAGYLSQDRVDSDLQKAGV